MLTQDARRKRRISEAQSVVFNAAGRTLRHPGLLWRAADAKHRHRYLGQAEWAEPAALYGLEAATMQDFLARGLDNPAYRFHRDGPFFSYFADNQDIRGASWLDVGAGTGVVSAYLSQMLASTDYEMLDIVQEPQTVGEVKPFDGTHLEYPDASFDMVMFSYVLHHAADDTIPLLRAAKRIARRYVIVTEDPKETADDYLWAYKHDKRGTFRGRREWLALFELLGYSIVHEEPLGSDIHSRHFYVLGT